MSWSSYHGYVYCWIIKKSFLNAPKFTLMSWSLLLSCPGHYCVLRNPTSVFFLDVIPKLSLFPFQESSSSSSACSSPSSSVPSSPTHTTAEHVPSPSCLPSNPAREAASSSAATSSNSKRRQGAIIESMHHHGKGVYSGTFSGELSCLVSFIVMHVSCWDTRNIAKD